MYLEINSILKSTSDIWIRGALFESFCLCSLASTRISCCLTEFFSSSSFSCFSRTFRGTKWRPRDIGTSDAYPEGLCRNFWNISLGTTSKTSWLDLDFSLRMNEWMNGSLAVSQKRTENPDLASRYTIFQRLLLEYFVLWVFVVYNTIWFFNACDRRRRRWNISSHWHHMTAYLSLIGTCIV